MGKTVFFALFAAVLLISGCAGGKGSLQEPFGRYSHQTFIREGTGETGLYLEGESWCVLIDLRGFADAGTTPDDPDVFLVRKNGQGIVASVYAHATGKETRSGDCQKRAYWELADREVTEVDIRDIGGKEVLVNTYRDMKRVDYCLYHEGYCFDFRFTLDADASEKPLNKILQSIAFAEKMSWKGRIQKVFSLYGCKLQLGMPDTWNYELKTGFRSRPAIVFTPAVGDAFSLHISPCEELNKGQAATMDRVRGLLTDAMASWQPRNADEPVPVEMFNEQDGVYIAYFDVRDEYYHAEDKGEYPYQRIGYAITGDFALSFRIFFRDSGRADAGKGVRVLEHMRLFCGGAEPVIGIAGKRR